MNDSLTLYESIAPLERDFQVKLKQNRLSGKYRAHWHEHIELLYFLSGEFEIVCGEAEYTALEGDLIFINSKERHSTSCNSDGEYMCLHLLPEFFSDVEFDGFAIETHIIRDAFIKEYFEKMSDEQKNKSAAYDLRLKSLAYSLMAYIISNYRRESDGDNTSSRSARFLEMHDIFAYISRSYTTSLTTAELARHFHLTEQYFCRMFKKATGQTPLGYINRYRTEKAAVLLKNTDQSITDIALSVGFDDPNYFSRTFKKYVGEAPREYRKSI